MTPFEQGYDAFLKGVPKENNPYDEEKTPYSCRHWFAGHARARKDRK